MLAHRRHSLYNLHIGIFILLCLLEAHHQTWINLSASKVKQFHVLETKSCWKSVKIFSNVHYLTTFNEVCLLHISIFICQLHHLLFGQLKLKLKDIKWADEEDSFISKCAFHFSTIWLWQFIFNLILHRIFWTHPSYRPQKLFHFEVCHAPRMVNFLDHRLSGQRLPWRFLQVWHFSEPPASV